MAVRLFLLQPLASLRGEHLPSTAMILEGDLADVNAFGVRLRVTRWLDEKGKELTAEPRDLLIPAAKVDHVSYR